MSLKKAKATRGSRARKKLNIREKSEIKALAELNNSMNAIERRTGINRGTVAKYLADHEAYNDPKIMDAVAKIKEGEIADLTVLNIEAKDRLHQLAPVMNPIEAIALMDRSFQQLRLLEGKSTQNIATISKLVAGANPELEDDFHVPFKAKKEKHEENSPEEAALA